MVELTIIELGERTGLASSALRFYERKGLIDPVGRVGGMRVYDESAVEQIALIDLLKISGFTLAEVSELIDTNGRVAADWRERARAKHEELGERLAEIERAQMMLNHTIDCPHDTLDDCPVHQSVVAAHAESLAQLPGRGRTRR